MNSGDYIDRDTREYSLEEHLEIKCKNNEKYKHLYAAWTTDKDVYTNSLSAVPVNFPHYSRHEASHSLSIINKIEMILGVERIKSLSPTDTFLILESAFSHDLGMIIPEDLLKSEWKKPSFKRFLKRLSTDGYDEDIMKAAKYLLEIQDNTLEFNEENCDWSIEVRDAVILITAEYFRKNHGSRSELWLRQSDQIATCINGNKFIPERIMNIVGKVATAHGRDFDDMLDNLERFQNGIGVDIIHPRFIACLIRLGDLLDLDNGRFNDVFEKTSPLPKSSKVHKEKHRSITHFLVSPERIEVSAVCESDTVYRETRSWFDWLSDELKNLSSKWSDIVPKGFQGGPPSLGDIKLSIDGAGNITEQLNLRFNIDPVRAFELIEGNGIYKDELVFIRELLQNAMDATKIKIWRDIRSGKYDDFWGSIDSKFKEQKLSEYDFSFPKQLPEKLKALYPIKINVNYEEAKDEIGKNQYIFTIEDKGCGISLKDLRRMENAGGSWEQDDELQDFIETMPGWLQPTGSFGIGLHSIFLITDKLEIDTKSEKEDGYKISFVSRRKNGYITVKKDNDIANVGTKITLKIKESKFEKMKKKRSDYLDFFDSDYNKKRSISILKERIEKVIKNITTLKVCLKLLDEEVIIKKDHVNNIVQDNYCGESEQIEYYISFKKYEEYIEYKKECVNNWNIEIHDKIYETIVNFRIDCDVLGRYKSNRVKIRFKEINCNNNFYFDDIELFNISIDIKKGKAKEVLAVSRDMLNENIYKNYMKRLNTIIIPKALEYLYEELDRSIKKDPQFIYNKITKNVNSNFQLLKLRLAFNCFLNKENEYMKEWGKDINISSEKNHTFNDIVKSNYIIWSNEDNLTDSLNKKVNEFKANVGEKECMRIDTFYRDVSMYINNNFSVIKSISIKSDSKYMKYLDIKKRKQQLIISGKKFHVIYFSNKEEAKDVLKILFDVDYKQRQRISCSAYCNNENNNELLYKYIIITKRVEEFDYFLGVKNNPYFISPFKSDCNDLIKSLDYDVVKVKELLKKEHNFDELVDWVSKNAMFKEDNEDYKNKVIETYTELVEDYLVLLKQEHNQRICSEEIENNESNMQLDKVAIDKVGSKVDTDQMKGADVGTIQNKELEEVKTEEKQDK